MKIQYRHQNIRLTRQKPWSMSLPDNHAIADLRKWQAVPLFPQRLETVVPGGVGNHSFCLLGQRSKPFEQPLRGWLRVQVVVFKLTTTISRNIKRHSLFC